MEGACAEALAAAIATLTHGVIWEDYGGTIISVETAVKYLPRDDRCQMRCLYLVETFPDGGPLLEWCATYGLEGIVCKRRQPGYAQRAMASLGQDQMC